MDIKIAIAACAVLGFCAVAAVTANPQVKSNTPLYTYRMEQASSGMSFLPTEKNDFTYTTEPGYTLDYTVTLTAGSSTPQTTVPMQNTQWITCETCGFTCDTCINTCQTCYCTCWDTCRCTCQGITCDFITCDFTCIFTCDTCFDTCFDTCWDTCFDTCFGTCFITCDPTCVDPTCEHTCYLTCEPTCHETFLPNCPTQEITCHTCPITCATCQTCIYTCWTTCLGPP